ncbi:class I SAM-dependent DNA methyltransferase [Streptomyces sp. NPDC054784]
MTSSELWTRETADRYDAEETEMSSAAVLGPTLDFLAGLAGNGRALEFAIGTGRVGVPLRERGVPVAGIELSEDMAAVLRRKIDADALPVTIGDMATTRVPGEFTLVYLVYNTISNLLTQDEQVECFRNAARHLAPGGRFVIELGVPPLRFLPPGQVAVPFDVSERHLGFDTFDLAEQLLVSHHFTREDGDGAGEVRYRRGSSRHRYAWPAELDLMARIAGLERERRVADWDGTPFTEHATKHVSVWRMPD